MTFHEAVHDFILNSYLLPISTNHKRQPKITQFCSLLDNYNCISK